MTERGSHDPSHSPISAIGRIDQVCDQFEKAWQAGNVPRIEDLLPQLPPPERDRLFEDLLEIELDFRQRSGTFLQLEDYQCRFPENFTQVEAVFGRVVKARRLGDYELLEELGRGGMGVVYKARQIYLNQTVAVKVLPHRYLDDPQAVARFRREMQSIGSLDHPNIVRAFNAGEAGGVHYLVMEYVDGVNMQHLIAADAPIGGPLDVGAACEIIRQAALGLQHAMEHGLVHRDVKPANLMLSRSGVVKLLDLGLAKFHAERASGEQQAGRLTQAGVTIGTIDYMAPEQWENSATADIRSDIYSLGCTLFFLLTGRAPYGDPAYDTNRKRLMAHVVAPIPSLPDHCPDCPPELEEFYLQMLAKDPRERFSTPARVAEALAEFADPEAVAELMASISASGAWNLAASPPTQSPASDTAKRLSGGSNSRRKSSSRRRIARQSQRSYTVLGLLALFFTAAAVTSIWLARRPHVNRPLQLPPDVVPLIATSPAAISREPLAAELALLPGLNGPWWFDEMPWYTPFARQALAEQVLSASDPAAVLGDRSSEYLDPNTGEVQRWLWEAIGRCRGGMSPCQEQLLDQLKAFSDSDREDNQHAAQVLDAAAKQFIDGHADKPWSAVDRHTLAVLQYLIASLDKRLESAEKAKQSYDLALAAYAAQSRAAAATRLLCLVDSAFLNADLLDSPKEARRRLDEALKEPELPVLFHVGTLVVRGAFAAATAMNPGEYDDHRFLAAKKLLEKSEAGKWNHPLAAHTAERHAWSLMDQWKVEEANKQFQEAYHIRLTNKQEKNPLAEIYVFQNRHGMAMASRYRGDLDAARRSYKKVVNEIKAALEAAERQPTGPGQQSFLHALRERLANSLERWADCELYGGAASGAAVSLVRAADYYDQARQIIRASEPGAFVVTTCKLAIVRALNGKTAAAQDALVELDKGKPDALGGDAERAALARRVADAVLKLSGPVPADGRKALRAFLDQFKLNPSYRDSTRRETMELQLFAAELLLSADLESDVKSAPRDLKYLDSLLAVFKGRHDMRPYLRRYYDLAIRACNKADLLQIVHYVLESHMADQPTNLSSKEVTRVVFHFTPKENFAIFLPPDGRNGKRIELDPTRQQIKEAASKGKSLHLNDELVALIREQRKAGREVDISWADATSRPAEDPDAISDREWPFGDQIARAAPRTKAGAKY